VLSAGSSVSKHTMAADLTPEVRQSIREYLKSRCDADISTRLRRLRLMEPSEVEGLLEANRTRVEVLYDTLTSGKHEAMKKLTKHPAYTRAVWRLVGVKKLQTNEMNAHRLEAQSRVRLDVAMVSRARQKF